MGLGACLVISMRMPGELHWAGLRVAHAKIDSKHLGWVAVYMSCLKGWLQRKGGCSAKLCP